MTRTNFSITVEILAPLPLVWSVLADVERWPAWTASISRVRRLSDLPLCVGSRIRIHQPKLPPALWRVTEWNPDAGFTWVSLAPGVRVTARHTVEATTHGTRVHLSIHYAGWFGRLLARWTAALNERYLAMEATGLKARCTDLYGRTIGMNTTRTVAGYFLIEPSDLHWRASNLMKIPNADFLERTKSELLGARLWRLPPKSANTLHKHVRSEEFYFVLEGKGRMRVGGETLTVPKHGGLLVGPDQLRQVFNDTEAEVLWLVVGAPEELEFLPGAKTKPDMSPIYPGDPMQLPKELAGVQWPPRA